MASKSSQTLKDFLDDNSNSSSSNGFNSFPRKASCQEYSSIRNLIQLDLINSGHAIAKPNNNAQKLRKTRSSKTISTFQAMINAVKNINFSTAVKLSPSILPRSLSRKLSKTKKETEIKNITVTVKDIIRWKSFRDLVEIDKPRPPSDFASSPYHCTSTTTTKTATTTTTTGSTCTPRNSNGSSWCDSDFTSEYLPSSEVYQNEVDVMDEKLLPCVGSKDPMEATTEVENDKAVGPQGRSHESDDDEDKEQEQQDSTLSVVLDFDDDDDEDSFDRSLANIERTKQKLMQNIQRFESLAKLETVNLDKWMSLGEEADVEEVEETNEVLEKARKLLNRVKETSSCSYNYKNTSTDDRLILDLFREELATNSWSQTRNEELECDMVRRAKAWINGELPTVKLGAREKREECVRDMERELGRWIKFGEEQQELGREVESEMIDILVDELLVHLL